MRLIVAAALALSLLGCAALSQPTDGPNTPGWVKTLDQVLNVTKDIHGQVTKGPTPDPTGGTIPYVGTALGVGGLLWYALRKLAGSVPADTHAALIAHADNQSDALASSTPTTVPAPVPKVTP